MIGTQRQNEILEYMKQHQTISVKQIVKNFYISEATARRDLNVLEKNGLIRRVFGGATLILGADQQVPLFVREKEFADEKEELCERASSYIKDGYVIFLDGSSTIQFLLPHLKKYKDIIVITNGLKIAQILGEMNIKVYLAGGLLMENSSVLVGNDAEEFINNFNADVCFFSCKGVSDDGKLTDTSYEETKLRKCYIKNSKKKIAILTSNKIGKTYIHTLCHIDEIDHLIVSNFFKPTQKI